MSTTSPARRGYSWAQLGLAVLSGLIYWAAFISIIPRNAVFLAFVPAAWAARDETPWRTLKLGAIMGIVSHAFAYVWLNHMLREFASAPLPLAMIVWLGFCVMQGTSYGVGLALARWLGLRTGWPWFITMPVGLTAMDFLYPEVFPSYVGNLVEGLRWLMQPADLFGVLGLTALIGCFNGAAMDFLVAREAKRARPWVNLALASVLTALACAYGAWRTSEVEARMAAAPKLRVGMVQSNVGGFANLNDPTTIDLYRKFSAELAGAPVDLVVWPEGAVERIVGPETNVRRDILGGTHVPLLFGGIRQDRDETGKPRLFNSAFLADAHGRVLGTYDKIVLLVFGEYLPLGEWFPILYKWIPEASHWGRGRSTAPLVMDDWRFATFICYEAIVPRIVQQLMEPHDGKRPNVMVNITNDSWYGPIEEQSEHLMLARMRTVEHHRAMVRSTNTGTSEFIDPTGRPMTSIEMNAQGTAVESIPKMEGTTLYEQVGDVAGYASLLALAAGFVLGRRKSRRTP